MADINLNINILEGENCPTLELIDPTDLSIVVNLEPPILADNSVTALVPENTTVTILVEKTGYDSYNKSIDVGSVDETIFIALNETVPVDFINIGQNCHIYTITNNGTSISDNVTYTITNLDGDVIGDNENISLTFGNTITFTSAKDNIYLITVKNTLLEVIRIYVIIDYCNILQCISDRILSILCDDCGCGCQDCEDYCKKDYEMKRIFLLQFDLFNRINREYRLNSYYTTIDDAKVNQLKTAQEIIDKLTEYCPCTNNNSVDYNGVLSNNNSKSGCGCS
jgi:hypothetical protein